MTRMHGRRHPCLSARLPTRLPPRLPACSHYSNSNRLTSTPTPTSTPTSTPTYTSRTIPTTRPSPRLLPLLGRVTPSTWTGTPPSILTSSRRCLTLLLTSSPNSNTLRRTGRGGSHSNSGPSKL